MKIKLNAEIEGNEFEEMYRRKIESFGNSAHIILPKQCIGKKAVIFLEREVTGEK